MFCKKCGKQIDDDSLYCSYCGGKQSSQINSSNYDSDISSKPDIHLANKKIEVFDDKDHFKIAAIAPKYDPIYEKEDGAVIIGIAIIVISFFLIAFRPNSYTDYDSFRQFNTFIAIASIIIRIVITIWVVSIAKDQNRDGTGWGWFAFFLPTIALIIIGTKRKLYALPEIISGASGEMNSEILTRKAQEFYYSKKYSESIRFSEKAILLNSDNHLAHEILKKSKLSFTEVIGSTTIVFRELCDNRLLKIVAISNKTIGADVFIDNLPATDGSYAYKSGTRKLIIENGKIKRCFFIEKFDNITIEASQINNPQKGDNVYLEDGNLAPTGTYGKGFMTSKLNVDNGKFVSYS